MNDSYDIVVLDSSGDEKSDPAFSTDLKSRPSEGLPSKSEPGPSHILSPNEDSNSDASGSKDGDPDDSKEIIYNSDQDLFPEDDFGEADLKLADDMESTEKLRESQNLADSSTSSGTGMTDTNVDEPLERCVNDEWVSELHNKLQMGVSL